MKIRRPHLFLALLFVSACVGGTTIVDDPVVEVVVMPENPTIEVGLTVQFTAEARDASGQVLTGRPIAWTSSDVTVATIDALGLATSLGLGFSAITATIGGVSDSEVLEVEAGECIGRVRVTLNAGDHQSYDGGTCLLLPSGQSGDLYRVAIVRPTLNENTSDVANVTLDISPVLSAAASPSTAPHVAEAAEAEPLAVEMLPGGPPKIDGTRFTEGMRVRAATRRFHYDLRERERELPLFEGAVLTGPTNTSPVRTSHPAPPARADMFLDLDCDVAVSRPVILIDFDDDLAIYQDSVEWSSAPLSTVATDMMLAYYANYVRDMVTQYWGALSDLDGNGRVIFTTTPLLPAGAASAVYSGDFLSPASCTSSNQGEVVYWDDQVISRLVDAQEPEYSALSIMAHEVKHVVSIYRSVRRAQFHNTWIEEGMAEISQTMSSRIAWAATGGPAIGVEINATNILTAVDQNGGLTPEMSGVVTQMADLVILMSTQPNSLIVNPDGASTFHTFYAAAWQWFRFMGDAWGDAGIMPFGDAPLFLAMTDSLAPAGTAALAQQTGRQFELLFEDLVVAISLHETGQNAAREFSTWNLTTATAIFEAPPEFAPAGTYPWPVTGVSPAAFTTATFSGPIGPSGMRFHDFVSQGVGQGAQIVVTGADSGKIIVTRVN